MKFSPLTDKCSFKSNRCHYSNNKQKTLRSITPNFALSGPAAENPTPGT